MRVLELDAGCGPRERGRRHGETFRPLIAELAAIRTELAVERGAFPGAGAVRELARAHLPVLAAFDAALHDELEGIAEGAALDPADVVILNHYTDLRDVPVHPPEPVTGSERSAPGHAGRAGSGEEGCSAVWARTAEGALLGQTWDMHGSAMPYVMMLGVPGTDGAPASWLLSITGCLGMCGFNEAGVAITINNLRSTDARVGVVWPALVRRVLRERTAEAGRDVVLEAHLGSGHHYLVADARRAFGIETSGVHRRLVFDGRGDAYVHTNHCLDPEVAACTVVVDESTTHDRYDALSEGMRRSVPAGRAELWARLGSHDGYPRFVCTHMASPARPHGMLTCGGIVMDLARADAWAAPGCLHHARPHRFGFGPGPGALAASAAGEERRA
ncbi:MAG: C45 family autoproteolytic acyltransferase/hydrolase [Myxococcota bacterium]